MPARTRSRDFPNSTTHSFDRSRKSNENNDVDDLTHRMKNVHLDAYTSSQLKEREKQLDEEFWEKIAERVKQLSKLEGWKINPNHQELGGAMGSAARLNDLQAEGIVGEILGKIYVESVKLGVLYYWRAAWVGYKEAVEQKIAYERDENGHYPRIYKVDPKTGKLNRKEWYQDNEAPPREVIAQNGYFNEPSIKECIGLHSASYLNQLYGQNAVPTEYAKLLFEAADEETKEKKRDIQADAAAAMAARPKPAPAAHG